MSRCECEAKSAFEALKFGKVRNIDNLRKLSSRKQIQAKKEAMGSITTGSIVGMGLLKTLELTVRH